MMKKRLEYIYLSATAFIFFIHVFWPTFLYPEWVRWPWHLISYPWRNVIIMIIMFITPIFSVTLDVLYKKNEQSLIQKLTLILFTSLFSFYFFFTVAYDVLHIPTLIPLFWLPLFCGFIYTLIVFNNKNKKVIISLKYSVYTLLYIINILTWFILIVISMP